jgi:transposase-like protein
MATSLGVCHAVFAFPPEIRRVIYTTNAIESVNARTFERSIRGSVSSPKYV